MQPFQLFYGLVCSLGIIQLFLLSMSSVSIMSLILQGLPGLKRKLLSLFQFLLCPLIIVQNELIWPISLQPYGLTVSPCCFWDVCIIALCLWPSVNLQQWVGGCLESFISPFQHTQTPSVPGAWWQFSGLLCLPVSPTLSSCLFPSSSPWRSLLPVANSSGLMSDWPHQTCPVVPHVHRLSSSVLFLIIRACYPNWYTYPTYLPWFVWRNVVGSVLYCVTVMWCVVG